MSKGSNKIKILWDGDVPGLDEHRVSLTQFAPAIAQLVKLYRHLVKETVRGEPQQSDPRGRPSKEVAWFDLQLESVESGSVGVSLVSVANPPANWLPGLLDQDQSRISEQFMDALDAGASGTSTVPAADRYYRTLPNGVKTQYVEWSKGGDVVRHLNIDVQRTGQDEQEKPLPFVFEFLGEVVAVGVEPGKEYVVVRQDGKQKRCTATAEQSERAYELRRELVKGTAVSVSGKNRLLDIGLPHETFRPLTPEEKEEEIFVRWHGLLERLSQ
ncbi:MAG: hypothetical protein AAF772_19205 [Acidobacteriota bacterium]